MRLDRIVVAVVLCLAVCAFLNAQSASENNHGAVFGKVGVANVYETATLGPVSVVDTEAIGAGGVEFRPIRTLRQLGFESELAYMSQHRSGLGVTTTNGNLLFLSENLVYHPFIARVEPYVLGGGGVVILNENLAPPTGTFHGRVFTFAGGVDIRLTGHWFLRPEGRAYAPRVFDKVFAVTGGLAYRW